MTEGRVRLTGTRKKSDVLIASSCFISGQCSSWILVIYEVRELEEIAVQRSNTFIEHSPRISGGDRILGGHGTQWIGSHLLISGRQDFQMNRCCCRVINTNSGTRSKIAGFVWCTDGEICCYLAPAKLFLAGLQGRATAGIKFLWKEETSAECLWSLNCTEVILGSSKHSTENEISPSSCTTWTFMKP